MNYKEAMEYITSRKKSGISLGLTRMKKLCERLGNPEKSLSFIHIAGTNGKGSTAAYISSILAKNGYFTGRYVSPVVFCYRECIQFENENGISYISKELLSEAVTSVAEAVSAMEKDGLETPTGFEIETAVSFLAFKKKKCQFVILEVGLGGREDATNVIDKVLVSVITPIGRDHMGMLGNTIEEIASEKAGIIREHTPVITYQELPKAKTVISGMCKKKDSPFTCIKREEMKLLGTSLEGFDFMYKQDCFHSRMAGSYQIENAVLAIEVCRQLGKSFHIDDKKVRDGVSEAFWHGRFEVINKAPLVIIDGAHNESGAKALLDSIRTFLPSRKIHAVMGVFKDKEYEKIVSILYPVMEDVIVVTAPTERGLPAEELQNVWERISDRQVQTAESVSEGVKEAAARCKKDDAVVVFGSLSLLSQCACGKMTVSV